MKKLINIIIVLSLSIAQTFSIDLYWVGGTGNWSDYANHWATSSGGATFHNQVPALDDNVYFDANSFSSAGQVVNIDIV
ncbi:MAG: hypothetical protein K8R53_01215, partial [Bacteroidales bacterium]|nr:hypothetical protein [Bacteroidales bacterium]